MSIVQGNDGRMYQLIELGETARLHELTEKSPEQIHQRAADELAALDSVLYAAAIGGAKLYKKGKFHAKNLLSGKRLSRTLAHKLDMATFDLRAFTIPKAYVGAKLVGSGALMKLRNAVRGLRLTSPEAAAPRMAPAR